MINYRKTFYTVDIFIFIFIFAFFVVFLIKQNTQDWEGVAMLLLFYFFAM